MSTTDTTCPDCRAPVGVTHAAGCDVARCLVTGHQRLSCDEEHDCGVDVWTGTWPGEAECAEFGWWVQDRCAEGLGFVPCAAGAPGAVPDLNRLRWDAVWDPDVRRWRERRRY